MRNIFIIIALIVCSSSYATEKEYTFNELLKEMQMLRNDMRADEVVKSFNLNLTDRINEEITSTEYYTNSFSEGSSASVGGFLMSIISFRKSATSSESYVFHNTEMRLDENRAQRNVRSSRLESERMKQFLKNYYITNAEKILKLKLLYVYGLQKFANHEWNGGVNDILELEKLGTFFGFYGEVSINHCVEHKYKTYTNSSSSSESKEQSFKSFWFSSRSGSSESSSYRQEFKSLKEIECDFKTTEYFEEGKESVLKYDLGALDFKIRGLLRYVYGTVIFNFNEPQHIFSFGNSYLDSNSGDHPFQ